MLNAQFADSVFGQHLAKACIFPALNPVANAGAAEGWTLSPAILAWDLITKDLASQNVWPNEQ